VGKGLLGSRKVTKVLVTAAEYDTGWDVIGVQFEADPQQLESSS
jgi:hypothetical protein